MARFGVLVAGAVLLSGAVVAPAFADGHSFRQTVKMNEAVAQWTTSDACAPTNVTVRVSDTVTIENGGAPNRAAELSVSVWQYNSCSRIQLRDAYGTIPLVAGQFSLDETGRLDTAAVSGVVAVRDFVTLEDFAVPVNMIWDGDNFELFKDEYKYSSKSPSYSAEQRSKGRHRQASPIGSVTNGTENLSLGSSWGQLTYTNRTLKTRWQQE